MITVAKWVRAPDEQGVWDGEDIIEGGGGYINLGHRWEELLRSEHESVHPYLEAIRASGVRICGECHQYGGNGSPVFSDGKQGLFSYRGWGDVMAAAEAEETGEDRTYMDFYMGCERCQS